MENTSPATGCPDTLTLIPLTEKWFTLLAANVLFVTRSVTSHRLFGLSKIIRNSFVLASADEEISAVIAILDFVKELSTRMLGLISNNGVPLEP